MKKLSHYQVTDKGILILVAGPMTFEINGLRTGADGEIYGTGKLKKDKK